MREQLFNRVEATVADAEFQRLLGYPPQHVPGDRAQELMAMARAWYAEHGRPWIYLREIPVGVTPHTLQLDGTAWRTDALRHHLWAAQANRAVVFAASAGAALEAQARQLWAESKPDEYFFLETYGSAVVEQLVAATNGHVCREASSEGLYAIPHFSPGYGRWDVAEQNALFDVLRAGSAVSFPEPLNVLSSGMLQPKKSLLGLIGLSTQAATHSSSTPCERCTFGPCAFRRAPYRRPAATAPVAEEVDTTLERSAFVGDGGLVPLTRDATYRVNARALAKWANERLVLQTRSDGGHLAQFRYDGTTCSNMGRPLAFEYRIVLGPASSGYRIAEALCRPTEGDEGHRSMCEYRRDPATLMAAIASEAPLVGRPLDDVLQWNPPPVSSGCYCEPESRLHKWGLVLETIHYALAQRSHHPVSVNGSAGAGPQRRPATSS